MSQLYDALQGLAPLAFKVLPDDQLEDMAQLILTKAELIAGSVPPPAGGLPFTSSNLSFTDPNSATSAHEMRPSTVRPPLARPEHEALWGSWGKRVEVPSREVLLDIPVYKLTSFSQGKNATWYGLRTIQEGLGFEKWKSALNHESDDKFNATLFPPPAVRLVAAEKELFSRILPGIGILQVLRIATRHPTSTTSFSNSTRDGLILRLTSNARSKTGGHSPKAKPPRQRICVSIPLTVFVSEIGTSYTSKSVCSPTIEIIREVPYVQFKIENELNLLAEERKRERAKETHKLTSSTSRRISGQRSATADFSGNRSSQPPQGFDHIEGRHSELQKRRTFTLSPIQSESGKSVDRGSLPTRSSFSLNVNAMLDKLENGGSRDPSFLESQVDVESNPVEWTIITRHDQIRSFSMFMGDKNFQTSMSYDAIRLLNWACSLNEWDIGKQDEDALPSKQNGIRSSVSRENDSTLGRDSRENSHSTSESENCKADTHDGNTQSQSRNTLSEEGDYHGEASIGLSDYDSRLHTLASDLSRITHGIALTTDSAVPSELWHDSNGVSMTSPGHINAPLGNGQLYNPHIPYSSTHNPPWDNQLALRRGSPKSPSYHPTPLSPPPRNVARDNSGSLLALSTTAKVSPWNTPSAADPHLMGVTSNDPLIFHTDRTTSRNSYMSTASDDSFYTALQSGSPDEEDNDDSERHIKSITRAASLRNVSTHHYQSHTLDSHGVTPTARQIYPGLERDLYNDVEHIGDVSDGRGRFNAHQHGINSLESPIDHSYPLDSSASYQSSTTCTTTAQSSSEYQSILPHPETPPRLSTAGSGDPDGEADRNSAGLDMASSDEPHRLSYVSSISPSGPPPTYPPPPPNHPVSPLSARFNANSRPLSPLEQPNFRPLSDRPISTDNQSGMPLASISSFSGTIDDTDEPFSFVASSLSSILPTPQQAEKHNRNLEARPRTSTRKLVKAAPVSFDRFVPPGASKRSLSVDSKSGHPTSSDMSSNVSGVTTPPSEVQIPLSSVGDDNAKHNRPEGRSRRNSFANAGTYIFRKIKHRGPSKEPKDHTAPPITAPNENRSNRFMGKRNEPSKASDGHPNRSKSFPALSVIASNPSLPDKISERPKSVTPNLSEPLANDTSSKTYVHEGSVTEEGLGENQQAPSMPKSNRLASWVGGPSPSYARHIISSSGSNSGTTSPNPVSSPVLTSAIKTKGTKSSASSSVVGFAAGTNTAPSSERSFTHSNQTISSAAMTHAVNSAKRWRTLYELSSKENSTLRAQVEELQRKLTSLTIALGRSEEGMQLLQESTTLSNVNKSGRLKGQHRKSMI